MARNRGIVRGLVYGAALWVGPCQAQTGKGSPSARLEIVPGGGVMAKALDAAQCDFGTFSLLHSAPLTQLLVVRNRSKATLEIERLESSCGCTTAMLPAKNGIPQTHLLPGATLAIRITLHPERLKPGALHKQVWVWERNRTQPSASLTITGFAQSPATFSPALLDFGSGTAGVSKSLRLTAALTAPAARSAWHLESTNPDVTIMPVQTAGGDKEHRREFRVALSSHASLGRVGGFLRLCPGSKAADPKATAPGATDDGGDSLSVPLAGEVLGDIAVRPDLVVFGSVAQGQSAERDVMLEALTPDTLQGLQLACPLVWLSARLLTDEPGTGATKTVRLRLTLRETAPPGGFQTDVVVTTRAGQRLPVTVLGSIIARSGK